MCSQRFTSVRVFDYADHEPLLELLSEEERLRSETFKYTDLKEKYIIRTTQLRMLLATELGRSPVELLFKTNKFGKPFLDREPSTFFNMSHSYDKFAIALCRHAEVGVDIERVNLNIEVRDLSSRFFSTIESDNLLACPVELQADIFFNIWTRKEAFIKCIGQGLSFGLDNFAVDHSDMEHPNVLFTDWDPNESKLWDMRSSSTGDYKLAVAAKGGLGEVEWVGI